MRRNISTRIFHAPLVPLEVMNVSSSEMLSLRLSGGVSVPHTVKTLEAMIEIIFKKKFYQSQERSLKERQTTNWI